MKKGLFIVVDGGDGAGKGTQITRAKELFGDRVVTTREPGGSPYAEEIRKLALTSANAKQADARTLFALMWAARADHLKNTIRPALEAGKIVICDRFDSSTFAYQIIAQKALELKEFFWDIREFYLGETKPDLYIWLDIDPVTGLKRKSGQGAEERNHFEDREIEFPTAMRAGFKEFFGYVPHKIVDASKSQEEVWHELLLVLEEQIEKMEV